MGNNRIYIVDWNKLATWLMPHVLRKGQLLAFVKALVSPINDLHSRFVIYTNYINYQLLITPQVCFMEKALNDRYDVELRRIQIVDADSKNALPLYKKAENKPLKLYKKAEATPIVLYTKGETAQFTVDFIVKVPADITFNTAEMTAFVNKYKLVSKTFKIITF